MACADLSEPELWKSDGVRHVDGMVNFQSKTYITVAQNESIVILARGKGMDALRVERHQQVPKSAVIRTNGCGRG